MKPITHYFGKGAIWVLSGLFVLPLIFLLLRSLAFTWTYPALLPEQWSGTFWLRIVSGNSPLGKGFFISGSLAVLTSIAATALALPVSQAISQHRYRRVLLLLAYFPFVLAPVIFATTLKIYFVRFGLSSTYVGVLIGHFLIAFPFAVLVLESGWNKRLEDLMNQARTLGANERETFMQVVIPAFKGLLGLCLFQTFLISWYEYGLASLLGQGQMQTLPIQVYQFIQEASPAFAALACCLLMLPPLFLLIVNKKYLLRTAE